MFYLNYIIIIKFVQEEVINQTLTYYNTSDQLVDSLHGRRVQLGDERQTERLVQTSQHGMTRVGGRYWEGPTEGTEGKVGPVPCAVGETWLLLNLK